MAKRVEIYVLLLVIISTLMANGGSAAKCPQPVFTSNVGFTPYKETFQPGDCIDYKCLTGFKVVGHADNCCLKNGKWGNPQPICSLWTNCPRLFLRLGFITPDKETYQHRETISNRCRIGFRLVGREENQCRDGAWEYRQPICAFPATCSQPASIPNGFYTPVRVEYPAGDCVLYICNPPLRLQGCAKICCELNGHWSGIAICGSVPQCSRPANISNGSFTLDKQKYQPGECIVYSCTDDYKLLGCVESCCKSNGLWSGTLAICLPKE